MVLFAGIVPFLFGDLSCKKNHRSKYIPLLPWWIIREMLVSCACDYSTPDLWMP